MVARQRSLSDAPTSACVSPIAQSGQGLDVSDYDELESNDD